MIAVCAVTGERALPVLEAAHIRPLSENAQYQVRNSILMRSDLHRLYDFGLVTVEANLTFRVSRSIERDDANDKVYHALDGTTIRVPEQSKASLIWGPASGIIVFDG